jgi:hypothetical protein
MSPGGGNPRLRPASLFRRFHEESRFSFRLSLPGAASTSFVFPLSLSLSLSSALHRDEPEND